MDDQMTCGKGLAAHSALPAKLGALTDAVAAVLEAHEEALDASDPKAVHELDAYRELVDAHRHAAAQLESIARRMAGYRDLPMGRHDMSVMGAPRAVAAFERVVTTQEELVALLQRRLAEDRQMLAGMRAGR